MGAKMGATFSFSQRFQTTFVFVSFDVVPIVNPANTGVFRNVRQEKTRLQRETGFVEK